MYLYIVFLVVIWIYLYLFCNDFLYLLVLDMPNVPKYLQTYFIIFIITNLTWQEHANSYTPIYTEWIHNCNYLLSLA